MRDRYFIYEIEGQLSVYGEEVSGFAPSYRTTSNREATEFILTWNALKLAGFDPKCERIGSDIGHVHRYGWAYNRERNQIDIPHQAAIKQSYPRGKSGGGFELVTNEAYTDGLIYAFDKYASKIYKNLGRGGKPYSRPSVDALKLLWKVFITACATHIHIEK